jgi:hypothetical protein
MKIQKKDNSTNFSFPGQFYLPNPDEPPRRPAEQRSKKKNVEIINIRARKRSAN